MTPQAGWILELYNVLLTEIRNTMSPERELKWKKFEI